MSRSSDSWLDWSKRLAAIAQNGLTYARDPFDVERYQQVREIAAEMLARGTGSEISVIRDLLAKETGYCTPKIDVRGVVFDDHRILLVQERSDGRWTLPGGWADPGESARESVVREVREEAGVDTRAEKLLAMFDREKHPHNPPFLFHTYKLFIRCALLGGSPKASGETIGAAFFAENELPELSITRITPGQVRRMFEHHRQPDLPADFD
jgi:ADP-ribose pyrophosphatase YjhB (NUDIX family)